MKKVALVVFCLFLLQCKKVEKESVVDYKDVFSECLETKDIVLIENGMSTFFEVFTDVYNNDGKPVNKKYDQFFEEVKELTLSSKFLRDQRGVNFLKELKQSSTFKKIYIHSKEQEEDFSAEEEEIPITTRIDGNGNSDDNIPDFYTLNVRGEFMNCLIQKSSNQELKEYFGTLKIAPDLSPNLKSSVLLEVMNNEYSISDSKLIEASIAFDLYFGLVLMFNEFE